MDIPDNINDLLAQSGSPTNDFTQQLAALVHSYYNELNVSSELRDQLVLDLHWVWIHSIILGRDISPNRQ